MTFSKIFFVSIFTGLQFLGISQGLEEVFVETYYIVDAEDEKSEEARGLREGMVTYRIWVDMAEGYRLLSIYGAPGNPFSIKTTTTFFNDTVHGKIKAPDIDHLKLGSNALILDSYIALSGANRADLAVLKIDDTDGSVLKPQVNTENFSLIERGVLMNQNPLAGIPVRHADGLMDGAVPALVTFGHDFAELENSLESSEIEFDNGAWAVLKGLPGPFLDKNYLLIAQLTTDGELSFQLNLQLLSPGGKTEYYVAQNPEAGEFSHPSLIRNRASDASNKISEP